MLIYDDDSEAGSDRRWALVPNNTWGAGGAQRIEVLCGFVSVFTTMIVLRPSESRPDTVSGMKDLYKYHLGFWREAASHLIMLISNCNNGIIKFCFYLFI